VRRSRHRLQRIGAIFAPPPWVCTLVADPILVSAGLFTDPQGEIAMTIPGGFGPVMLTVQTVIIDPALNLLLTNGVLLRLLP